MSLAAAALLALSAPPRNKTRRSYSSAASRSRTRGRIPRRRRLRRRDRRLSDDHEAFNNRGALRFMLSDFKGADEDFSRRRPEPQGPQGLGNRCLLAVVEQAGEGLPDCVRAAQTSTTGPITTSATRSSSGTRSRRRRAPGSKPRSSPRNPAEPLLGLAIAALRSGERRNCPTLLKGAIALKPLIGRGPRTLRGRGRPFFAQQARRAVKELLRLFPVKVEGPAKEPLSFAELAHCKDVLVIGCSARRRKPKRHKTCSTPQRGPQARGNLIDEGLDSLKGLKPPWLFHLYPSKSLGIGS